MPSLCQKAVDRVPIVDCLRVGGPLPVFEEHHLTKLVKLQIQGVGDKLGQFEQVLQKRDCHHIRHRQGDAKAGHIPRHPIRVVNRHWINRELVAGIGCAVRDAQHCQQRILRGAGALHPCLFNASDFFIDKHRTQLPDLSRSDEQILLGGIAQIVPCTVLAGGKQSTGRQQCFRNAGREGCQHVDRIGDTRQVAQPQVVLVIKIKMPLRQLIDLLLAHLQQVQESRKQQQMRPTVQVDGRRIFRVV